MLIYLAISVTTFLVKVLLYATLQMIAQVHLRQESQQSPSLASDIVV